MSSRIFVCVWSHTFVYTQLYRLVRLNHECHDLSPLCVSAWVCVPQSVYPRVIPDTYVRGITYMYAYSCVCIKCVCVCVRVYAYTYVYVLKVNYYNIPGLWFRAGSRVRLVFVWVCVCLCVHVFRTIHFCMYWYAHTGVQMWSAKICLVPCVPVCACVCLCVSVQTQTYIYVFIYWYMYIYMFIEQQNITINTHLYAHIKTSTFNISITFASWSVLATSDTYV